MKPIVVYYRVSTARQGASGLGLDAQADAVRRYLNSIGQPMTFTKFTEIESGKKANRPKLAEALAYCKKHRATLVIAKLDRLARNVHFISGLMESGVDFVACDNPEANRLTLHILAAVAENEARAISERTTAALAAARERGVKLGGTRHDLRNATRVLTERAEAFRARVLPAIREAQEWHPGATLNDLAAALNARGVKTPRGGEWSAKQVSRVLEASE